MSEKAWAVGALSEKLEAAIDDAKRVYKTGRDAGQDAVSVGFDAGRVDGLRMALEIVQKGWADL